jgi:hypothetical protein
MTLYCGAVKRLPAALVSRNMSRFFSALQAIGGRW